MFVPHNPWSGSKLRLLYTSEKIEFQRVQCEPESLYKKKIIINKQHKIAQFLPNVRKKRHGLYCRQRSHCGFRNDRPIFFQ